MKNHYEDYMENYLKGILNIKIFEQYLEV